MNFTCVVQNGLYVGLSVKSSLADQSELARPQAFRAVHYRSDDMPAYQMGKAVASLEEAQALGARAHDRPHDFFWDAPNDEERAAVAGIVCVMRPVDVQRAVAALYRQITTASGNPPRGEIVLSAVHPNGQLAWVESRSDIAHLFIASGGEILLSLSLAKTDTSNYGYEGCHAQWLRWFGDRLVVVSHDKGSYLRSIDPVSGVEAGIHLQRSWEIDGDLVVWSAGDPGLLRTASLPSLDPWPPLPHRGARAAFAIHLKLGLDGRLAVRNSANGNALIDSLTMPSHIQRANYSAAPNELLDALEFRLRNGSHTMHLRLILESAAHAFTGEPSWRKQWEPSPRWIPVYLFRHFHEIGRTAEAAALVQTLEYLALALPESQPETGWDPSWTVPTAWVELAERHCRREARIVAEVCQSGVLPPGIYCLLFDPAPQSDVPGSRVTPEHFPAVLRRAFDELVALRPKRLATSW